MIIYLLGFMGSGKTSAGKRLAAALDYTFIDLDSMIESEAGCSISEIFSDSGEERFREIEKIELGKTGDMKNCVIACGGGTPCFYDNMEYMNRVGFTVYLELSKAQLLSRIEHSRSKRPLVAKLSGDELIDYIDSTLDSRAEYYRRAKISINGFDLNIPELKRLLPEP